MLGPLGMVQGTVSTPRVSTALGLIRTKNDPGGSSEKFAEAQADSADAGYEKAPGPRKIGVGLETIKQLQAILEKLGLLPAPTPGLLGGFLIIQSSII